MTQEPPGSTSSAETEPSLTDWAELSRLGQAIISQLSISEQDTLCCWMAYRLAELLNRAKTDDSAKEAATDLVLRLWRQRSNWPNGWPPSAVASQRAWLFPPDRRRSRRPAGGMKGLMRAVTDSLTEEYQFWLRFASQGGRKLTPAEEVMLAAEPRETRIVFRQLMELNNQQEPEPTAPEAREQLESILQARRVLLQAALDSDADEPSPAAAQSAEPDPR